MRCIILGFVAGAAVLQTRAALPEHPGLILLALLASFALLASASASVVIFSVIAARLQRLRAAFFAPILMKLLCGAALGYCWAALLAQLALAPALAQQAEGRDLIVTGTIASLPYRADGVVRFNFDVEKVSGGDVEGRSVTIPPRLALGWYSGNSQGATSVPGDVQPGERWELLVRLQRPHGNANPDTFDYEVWLLEQGVRATGYVRPDQVRRVEASAGSASAARSASSAGSAGVADVADVAGVAGVAGSAAQLHTKLHTNRRLSPFVVGFGNLVERCRALLRARILVSLAGRDYAGVIVALVVGDQRAIPASDWQVFNRTGIGHLISISGLHITMVAGLFALLASTLWRHSFFTDSQLPLILPAQKVAALCGAAIALLYVLLAGFGVPAQRTLYMLIVVAAALWTGRIASVSHVLCTALGLVVLLDPWAVLWPGFWLSFGAVALILYASVGRIVARTVVHTERSGMSSSNETGRAAELVAVQSKSGRQAGHRYQLQIQRLRALLAAGAHTQYVVTLGLVPLTMLLFAQVSLVSPLANALAIPLISLVVTPLALLGSLLPAPVSTPLLLLAHALVALLAQFLTWLSTFALASWSAPLPSWWIFCWALAGTLWMLAPRGWPQRWVGLVAWMPLLTALPAKPPDGQMWVTAFDVGQGMALLIETSTHRLLYDTGPAYSPDSNGGSRVINPYLLARGIAALDYVIVTHSDIDHAGGALAVLANVDVALVLSSLPVDHPVARAAPRHRHCQAGQGWTWDGVRFEILHPTAASYDNPALTPNARSCVLKVSAGGKSILLAADIEAAQEAQLMERERARDQAMAVAGGSDVAASSSQSSSSPSTLYSALRSDVLLAPHHGSGTSSTPAFLQAVQPAIALFQVGYRNRYHHPKLEVFERYRKLGIERLRTDEAGAITLKFGPTLSVTEYRNEHARYWYGR